MAATVPIAKAGDVNELLEAAKSIGEPPSEQDVNSTPQTPGENGVGSFERFMHSFGAPGRWAGAN